MARLTAHLGLARWYLSQPECSGQRPRDGKMPAMRVVVCLTRFCRSGSAEIITSMMRKGKATPEGLVC